MPGPNRATRVHPRAARRAGERGPGRRWTCAHIRSVMCRADRTVAAMFNIHDWAGIVRSRLPAQGVDSRMVQRADFWIAAGGVYRKAFYDPCCYRGSLRSRVSRTESASSRRSFTRLAISIRWYSDCHSAGGLLLLDERLRPRKEATTFAIAGASQAIESRVLRNTSADASSAKRSSGRRSGSSTRSTPCAPIRHGRLR